MKVRYRKAALSKADFDAAIDAGWKAAEAEKIDRKWQSAKLERLFNRPEPDQDADRFQQLDIEWFARY